jgi:hypothetical protein
MSISDWHPVNELCINCDSIIDLTNAGIKFADDRSSLCLPCLKKLILFGLERMKERASC